MTAKKAGSQIEDSQYKSVYEVVNLCLSQIHRLRSAGASYSGAKI